MGATPQQAPDRYRAGNPGELLPLNVSAMAHPGHRRPADSRATPSSAYAENAKRIGDTVNTDIISVADHFDIVDPQSKAWPRVRAAFLKAAQ